MNFDRLSVCTDAIDGAARLDVNITVVLVIDLNFYTWLNCQRFTRKNNNGAIHYIWAATQRPSCILVNATRNIGLGEGKNRNKGKNDGGDDNFHTNGFVIQTKARPYCLRRFEVSPYSIINFSEYISCPFEALIK